MVVAVFALAASMEAAAGISLVAPTAAELDTSAFTSSMLHLSCLELSQVHPYFSY